MGSAQQIIGNYRIVEKLGAGGMGEVWAAEHLILGRTAAIKILRSQLGGRADTMQRFFNEARIIADIEHPGVVQVFDFGYQDGLAYIVMERLAGQTLAERLAEAAPLSVPLAVHIAGEVASTLAVVHERGVVHRDLKPENIFLLPATGPGGVERVKILDFGVAKIAMDADEQLTGAGAVLGTPRYMAPEQVQSRTDIDHRADIYSLSCVLFHMLCGRPPFVVDGLGGLMLAHMQATPPRPDSLNPAIPESLNAVILRGLSKRADERQASMEAFLGELGPSVYDSLAWRAGHARAASEAGLAGLDGLAGIDGFGSIEGRAQTTTLGGAARAVTGEHAEPSSRRRSVIWRLGVPACVVLGSSLAALAQWHGGGNGEAMTTPAAAEVAPGSEAWARTPEEDGQGATSPARESALTGERAPDRPAEMAEMEEMEDAETVEEIRMVEVATSPPGASIRREDDDEIMGQTPFAVPLPPADESVALLLEKDGFEPARVVLGPESADVEAVELTPESRSSRRRKSRRSHGSDDPFGYR